MNAETRATLDTAQTILAAYDRGVLDIDAEYLARTLRMLVSAVRRNPDDYQAGLTDERDRIASLASQLGASFPADHPKGAMASFADWLRTRQDPDSRLDTSLTERKESKCCRTWPGLLDHDDHNHRCRRRLGHGGWCKCRCGMRVRERFEPDTDGRLPAYKIGKDFKPVPGTGLELALMEFGSQDGGWAWIQVRAGDAP